MFLICGLLAGLPAASDGQDSPVLTGYVTRAALGSDFDVNGIRVLCSGVRAGSIESNRGTIESAVGCPGDAPFLGEPLEVYGARHIEPGTIDRADAIIATRIERQSSRNAEISGSAVIDAAPIPGAAGTQASDLLIRADGYRIRITGKRKVVMRPPLQSLADVKAGGWIKYKGKFDAAIDLIATSVEIGPNALGSREQRLREKDEYDPTAVPADAKQNLLKNAITLGYDPKEFPASKDTEMQARVERIGASLVPAYQRALADSDAAKIRFRFQVIDTKRFRDAFALPSGIVLVPHQVVERMQNDSQLASVLADGIARVLERQQYRTEGKTKTAYTAMLAGAFVPYGWMGMSIAGEAASGIQERAMEQSGRTSLTLLHDAGYDIDQAPLAWWLLAPGKPQPLSEIETPDRSVYLYRILGEIWHNPHASADANPQH